MLSAIDVITLGFIFGIQIYLDFSAYSTIAIGSEDCLELKFQKTLTFHIKLQIQEIFGRDGTYHFPIG